jgi:hypothetical protein
MNEFRKHETEYQERRLRLKKDVSHLGKAQ